MLSVDRYLLRQVLLTCLVMTGIGLAVLLLERVIMVGLVANPNNALGYVGQMLLLLTPPSASPCLRPFSSACCSRSAD